jgi:hypothetical protein
MKPIGLTTFLSVAFIAAPALAAPPQLLDKTITISFTATGQAKSPDGQTRNFNTQLLRIIYVSSAGRLFMRGRASWRGGSRGGDFGPGEGGGSFSFQGNRLVGVVPFETGARQITVTFDPGFSSCSASVIEGHAGGVIRRTGPDGIRYEVTGGTTSAVSCSIRAGNAFASE